MSWPKRTDRGREAQREHPAVFIEALSGGEGQLANYYSVNFSKLYKAEYMHPSAKADIAQENARHAVDCLQDSGMFDLHC